MKTSNESGNERKSNKGIFAVIGILLLVILFLLLRSCNSEPPTQNNAPTEQDVEDGKAIKLQTGEYVYRIKESAPSKGNIDLPLITNTTVTKDYPYLTLESPDSNKDRFLIKYIFTDVATDEVIYESDWLEGDFKYSVNFYELLGEGDFDLQYVVKTKDAETLADQNGITMQFVLTCK